MKLVTANYIEQAKNKAWTAIKQNCNCFLELLQFYNFQNYNCSLELLQFYNFLLPFIPRLCYNIYIASCRGAQCAPAKIRISQSPKRKKIARRENCEKEKRANRKNVLAKAGYRRCAGGLPFTQPYASPGLPLSHGIK